MSALYVFIGGGLGALCRYAFGLWIPKAGNGFPLPTFMANFISCILLGLLMAYFMNSNDSSKYQLLMVTGFCGGFSTFSSFSAESYELLQSGNYSVALLYLVLSFVLCLVAIVLGIKIFGLFSH